MADAGRVVIPEELAEEVREHPERFRPHAEPYESVLNLHAGDVCEVIGPADGLLHVMRGGLASTVLEAWALVGSVDGGGQWPEPGDRVLILDSMCGVQGVQTVEEPPGRVFRGLGVGTPVGCFECDRWAVLPPAEPPSPASQGGSAGSVPAETVSPNPLRKSLVDTLTLSVERMAETLDLLGRYRGPDDLMGFWHDARLRAAEVYADAWCAGADVPEIATEYGAFGVREDAVLDVVAAWLYLTRSLLAARIPQRDWGAAVAERWPEREETT